MSDVFGDGNVTKKGDKIYSTLRSRWATGVRSLRW
jgi:hypothetical protein